MASPTKMTASAVEWKHRSSAPSVSQRPPDWYGAGLEHIWLPYAQMRTARPPLPVARTYGCRIVLSDGRELIDGIASWWTACRICG